MTSKRVRSTSKSVVASRRSKRTKTQAEETNDKPESPDYLDVFADEEGVIAENEAASSQKQQDDALEAKEASEVDEDDSSQKQTESGHSSKGNKDGEDDEYGEGDNEDEEDDEDGEEDLEMEFYSNFEPLESFPHQKIDKLNRDLAGVTAIRRDLAGMEKKDIVSKAINEVVASYAAGNATRTNDDHHSCGGGYTPLDAGGVGDVGGASGRYILTAEEVRYQEDTP
ncbi:hypothetical protein HAX54_036953 [Datura stramonium]|uniref:Uncharacterized protein n=1 Tax=Datura stramonium TaxID=4076 RepID=A0ABS8SGS4_DATST|nr:hypothetical protein [Datura stramonium]